MPVSAVLPLSVADLRERIASIASPSHPTLAFGVAEIDRRLGHGGVATDALHEFTAASPCLRAFAPAIRDRAARTDHGRIIVTSSTQGQHGTRHGAAYSASKWGIIGLMKSAALEFGEYGITVNALIPGLIDTALTRHEDRYAQAIEDGDKQPTGDEAKDEQLAKQAMIAQDAARRAVD